MAEPRPAVLSEQGACDAVNLVTVGQVLSGPLDIFYYYDKIYLVKPGFRLVQASPTGMT
jgi:hypothetical protein